MRFSTAFRLVWIDAVLQRGDRLRRADLVEAFGISVPQASSDLATYRRLFPGAARYDSSKKGYFKDGPPCFGGGAHDAVLKAQKTVKVWRAVMASMERRPSDTTGVE